MQQLKDEFGFEVDYLSVDTTGCISLDELKQNFEKIQFLSQLWLLTMKLEVLPMFKKWRV
ncbi:hypothetical protein [Erysipelothrix piscisicarius]|uniref:hypothetical protein n=1 Tax=Erysipelothrix piscisicarius TaxID=2485784 RepID=UPI001E45384B|nr:hypothetical protein [Erysipelothrix piscisicarius]